MVILLILYLQENSGDLLDGSPDSQKHILILKQCMSVYEALMGFLISSWSPNSENTAHKINCLFQGYSRLVDLSKVCFHWNNRMFLPHLSTNRYYFFNISNHPVYIL